MKKQSRTASKSTGSSEEPIEVVLKELAPRAEVERMPAGRWVKDVIIRVVDINRQTSVDTLVYWWVSDGDIITSPVLLENLAVNMGRIEEATWALKFGGKVKTGGTVSVRLEKVVVWETCNPERLRTAIKQQLSLFV